MGLAHWDDVAERQRRAKGEMDAVWQALGDAAGTVGVGLNRVRVAPGKLPDPAALARRLRGGLLRALRARGSRGRTATCTRCGRATASSTRPTTTSTRSSPAPTGSSTSSSARVTRPRSAGSRARARSASAGRGSKAATTTRGTSRRPAPPLEVGEPKPRPENIRNVDEVELEARGQPDVGGLRRRRSSPVSRGSSSQPGKMGSVPHCHSEEEEIFVILDGSATLHLWPSPRRVERRRAARAARAPARPCRRAAAWHRHRRTHFIAGDEGCTMLVYGTRKPNDMAYYPRSNKIVVARARRHRPRRAPRRTGTENPTTRYVRSDGAPAIRRRRDDREDRRAVPPPRVRLPVVGHLRRARLVVRLRPLRRAAERQRQERVAARR